jgi:hypothetical protein
MTSFLPSWKCYNDKIIKKYIDKKITFLKLSKINYYIKGKKMNIEKLNPINSTYFNFQKMHIYNNLNILYLYNIFTPPPHFAV